MSRKLATKTTIPTGRDKDLAARHNCTREQAAEIHAIRRMKERYAFAGITFENAPETMIEHLAMLLAGQSERRLIETDKLHRGNEVHRIWWNGTWFYLSFDPSIMRIVTYLPPVRKTERLARPKILRQKQR